MSSERNFSRNNLVIGHLKHVVFTRDGVDVQPTTSPTGRVYKGRNGQYHFISSHVTDPDQDWIEVNGQRVTGQDLWGNRDLLRRIDVSPEIEWDNRPPRKP